MTWAIGDAVRSRVSDYAGFVKDVRGGPDGPIYIVTAPGTPGTSETFTAEQLQAGPPAPEYKIGARVKVHGGLGVVAERNGDEYLVEVTRHRRSFAFVHRYRLPAWRIAIGGGT